MRFFLEIGKSQNIIEFIIEIPKWKKLLKNKKTKYGIIKIF